MSELYGVLALQGDFAAHLEALRALDVPACEVRRIRDLDALRGLVLPGGESSALLKLMGDEAWFDALRAFHARGGRLFGTCAGAILLAREVVNPAQPSLGLLDVRVERNGYGRQLDSFETTLDAPALGGPIRGVFIRAPRFRALGPNIEVLACAAGEPVLVRAPGILAASFHPEIAGESRLHRLFTEN